MIFERIKSEGLAHNSYFLGSAGVAAVIDPRRDVQVYTDLAFRHGMKIQFIFETHRNEDYVIGSLELAEVTKAAIYHGPGLEWRYGNTLKDGQEFSLGKLSLSAIHTPGHTDESMSYILTDMGSGKSPVMVFTGDALFVNDSGRVDLYGPDAVPHNAANLYDSLYNRILPLGDGLILCPAHGAGSVCGMNIADRDESTLGIERLQNPSLKFSSKEDFVNYKASEQPEKPPYFLQMEKYNQEGPPLLHGVPMVPTLTPDEFLKEMKSGALVVDVSMPPAFGGAHVHGAFSIWLEGLSDFAGWVLPYNKPVLLVLEDHSQVDIAARYLIRVGYDRLAGFLKGGIEGWYNAGLPVEHLPLISVQQLKDKLDQSEDITVLDVRRQSEWNSGHVQGAQHIFVGRVPGRLSEIPRDKPVAVMCSVGHRGGLGASMLLRAGFTSVYNVLGGFNAWKRAKFPVAK